ncbi:MAG: dTDP-4-dehydrorhamnose 3,5-epimerase [Burkholderiaceae bacterium]|nr:dTDP-4-dehydrorhamnose 3,5-epimerase [Burkholderiaceae bacterium]
MKVRETTLPGCLLIQPQVFEDRRGFFYENWNAETFARAGLPMRFVQSNVSRSAQGVLRGLHCQWPDPQGKLVHVLEGEVWDVAVDVRLGSPTFACWTGAVLSARNRHHLWIPEGFAHGFLVLSEAALLGYLCTAPYSASSEFSIRWDDPSLSIEWFTASDAPLLSERDARAPALHELPSERLPVYDPNLSR